MHFKTKILKGLWICSLLLAAPLWMAASCDDLDGCYSPTQNTSHAYDKGASGCDCNPKKDAAVCANGAALICDSQSGEWQAVEDGPCMPEAPCMFGEVVQDESGCLQDDAYCYELPDGTWCTSAQEAVCPFGYSKLADGESCPQETDTPICYAYSEGVTCNLTRVMSIAECESENGQAQSDPGNGSLVTVGCAEGWVTLGYIDLDDSGWIEGGLCCKAAK